MRAAYYSGFITAELSANKGLAWCFDTERGARHEKQHSSLGVSKRLQRSAPARANSQRQVSVSATMPSPISGANDQTTKDRPTDTRCHGTHEGGAGGNATETAVVQLKSSGTVFNEAWRDRTSQTADINCKPFGLRRASRSASVKRNARWPLTKRGHPLRAG